jgi:DNA gyrase inhibitor GyrI
MNIGRAFEMLFHWLAVRGLVDPRARSLGIYFDDPSAVAEDDLRSMACCELFSPDDVKFEAPVSRVEVAGGSLRCSRISGRMRSFVLRISGCMGNGCRAPGVKPERRRFSRFM